MNRDQRRLLHHEEQVNDEGEPVAGGPVATRRPVRALPEERKVGLGARAVNYLRDVRTEMSKVLWPKRSEVVNYSTVVLTTLVLLALLIFGLNLAFAKGVAFLFR